MAACGNGCFKYIMTKAWPSKSCLWCRDANEYFMVFSDFTRIVRREQDYGHVSDANRVQ